ncbi:MAG: TonB-dependent receptor, partial [Acidobacteria bacterium]|nr:TonB-dependent receptor [Acidobacteriota bacterium]
MAPLCAQSQGVIHGTVLDPQGRAVEAATVSLFHQGGGPSQAETTLTSRDGKFAFATAASNGDWLEVDAQGFRTAIAQPASGGSMLTVRLQVEGIDQQIFVTAEAGAQSIDQVSKAATLVTAEEIAQRNENSLYEAVRDTPGLLVRNLGGLGQQTSIRMRGLRSDATAILIDGLRFRDSATIQGDASAFISNLNIINPSRVEVLRGSGSSLYGSNAVGGTINVVTDPGGGQTHGELQAEGGSLGLMRGRATVSGGLFENRLAYSTGLLHLNVLSGVDGDDRTRSSGIQQFVRYVPASRTSLSGRLFFSDDFVQSNVSPMAISSGTANAVWIPAIPFVTFTPNQNDPDSRRASRFWSGAFIARQSIAPSFDIQASYQRAHTHRVFENGPAGIGFQPVTSNQSVFNGDIDTVDARANWRANHRFALTGGYEFERELYDNSDDDRMPAPTRLTVRTTARQRSHAAYFAMQNSLAKQRLQISLSGRAQGFALDAPRFVYSGVANNYANAPVRTPPRALTGDVAISYFLQRSSTKLRAHGGNSYRAPGLYERYGSGFYFDTFSNSVLYSPYGDPRLSPDRYNSVDAGVDQYLFRDRVRLSATWFYTRIAQITQFDFSYNVVNPATDPFGRFSGYYNGAGGTSRGVELTGETRIGRSATVRASYWYVNSGTDQDISVPRFYRALGIPAHNASAFYHQQFGRKTSLTMDLYHSGVHYAPLYTSV